MPKSPDDVAIVVAGAAIDRVLMGIDLMGAAPSPSGGTGGLCHQRELLEGGGCHCVAAVITRDAACTDAAASCRALRSG